MVLILGEMTWGISLNYGFHLGSGLTIYAASRNIRGVVSEAAKERARQFRKTERGKASSKRSLERSRGTLMRWAGNLVYKAVAKKRIPPASNYRCVDCKRRQAKVYDHRDYTKPYSVEPVCISCNSRRGPGKHWNVRKSDFCPLLLLLLCVFSQNAWPQENWLCTEDSSQVQGSRILACGIGEGANESIARKAALKNATEEFSVVCGPDTPCGERKYTAQPSRATCERDKDTLMWKCYRLVVYESDKSYRVQIQKEQQKIAYRSPYRDEGMDLMDASIEKDLREMR